MARPMPQTSLRASASRTAGWTRSHQKDQKGSHSFGTSASVKPALVGQPLIDLGIDHREDEVGEAAAGLERGQKSAQEFLLRAEDKLDSLARLLLEGGDGLADRLVLLGVDALLPPDDEIGSPGAERRERERGGEEDSPDPHGDAPGSASTTS